jgi:hypothetical protein
LSSEHTIGTNTNISAIAAGNSSNQALNNNNNSKFLPLKPEDGQIINSYINLNQKEKVERDVFQELYEFKDSVKS